MPDELTAHRTRTNDRNIAVDIRDLRLPLVPPRVDYLAAVEPLEDRS